MTQGGSRRFNPQSESTVFCCYLYVVFCGDGNGDDGGDEAMTGWLTSQAGTVYGDVTVMRSQKTSNL